jgi:tight adherence protein C
VTGVLAAAAGALAGAGLAALAIEHLSGRAARARLVPALAAAALRAALSLASRLRLGRRAGGGDVTDRLASAGCGDRMGATEWAAVKVSAAVAAGVVAAALGGSLPLRLQLLALAAAPAAGFFAPEFWVARRVARRLAVAGQELAPMLDLLQVAVHAGAAPGAALGAVGARFRGPLAAEWRAAATAIALGTLHDEAVVAIARRLPSQRVHAFVDCLRRARRHGVPLAESLGSQAAAARHEQRIRIREQAGRAGPKIRLVVAFVLVPSVMLIVAAALVAELTAPGLALSY